MKHRILTVLFSVVAALCLCFGLVACGGTSEDPPAASIEGIWTGATGNMAGTTLTLDVDGDTMHMVVKAPSSYVYYALTKAEDGSFTYSPTGKGTLALSVNAENKLEYKYTPAADASATDKAANFTFETKTALPAAADITGTKYATIVGTDAEINFTTPAIKYGDTALTNVKLINVGGYKVFTAKYGEDDVQVVAFKEGTANKAYVSLAYEVYDLSDTAPTPTTAIEGVWTGNTGEYAEFTVTIDVDADGETARMIMLRNAEDSNFYAFYWVFTKTGDGIYTLESAENGNLSIRVNGTSLEFKTSPPAGMEQFGTQTAIFPNHEDLPAALNITGIKYAAPDDSVHAELFEITFGANPAIRYNKEKVATGVTAIDVGGYKVLSGTIDGNAITVIAYKEGATYYAAINIEGDHNRDRFMLSDTEPEFNPGGGATQDVIER